MIEALRCRVPTPCNASGVIRLWCFSFIFLLNLFSVLHQFFQPLRSDMTLCLSPGEKAAQHKHASTCPTPGTQRASMDSHGHTQRTAVWNTGVAALGAAPSSLILSAPRCSSTCSLQFSLSLFPLPSSTHQPTFFVFVDQTRHI